MGCASGEEASPEEPWKDVGGGPGGASSETRSLRLVAPTQMAKRCGSLIGEPAVILWPDGLCLVPREASSPSQQSIPDISENHLDTPSCGPEMLRALNLRVSSTCD